MILFIEDIDIILRALNSYNNNPNVNQTDKKLVFKLYEKIKMHREEDGLTIQENQIRSSHYGGENNPYEAIKVIDAWKANFNLGNVIKYICRVCLQNFLHVSISSEIPAIHLKLINDLKKARTYLDFEIEKLENMK